MGDLDNLLNSKNEDENNIILKGRFKAVETNTYGLFIIFFNEYTGTAENLMVIASHYSSLFDIDPHLPWYTVEENIINLKWKGDIAVNISLDLQNYLESTFERDRGAELFSFIKNNDETRIETLLQSIFIKPLSDRNIQLETVSETVSNRRMEDIRKERDKSREKKAPEKSPQFSVKGESPINVDLVLAPVSGIPIYELKLGDRIMVKINDKSIRGNYYIDLLGARVNGNLIPIPAEVSDIKKGEDMEYSILCKLDDDVFGQAVETEQVKLKKYDELVTKESTTEELPVLEEIKKKREFPVFTVIIGGLMFLVILVFLIMWFYNII